MPTMLYGSRAIEPDEPEPFRCADCGQEIDYPERCDRHADEHGLHASCPFMEQAEREQLVRAQFEETIYVRD